MATARGVRAGWPDGPMIEKDSSGASRLMLASKDTCVPGTMPMAVAHVAGRTMLSAEMPERLGVGMPGLEGDPQIAGEDHSTFKAADPEGVGPVRQVKPRLKVTLSKLNEPLTEISTWEATLPGIEGGHLEVGRARQGSPRFRHRR